MPSLKTHLAVLLGYLLLSLAVTWPLMLHWHTAVVGGISVAATPPEHNPRFEYGGFEDASQNIWNVWWTGWALEHGQNPFWSPLLYYPEGVQMYVQTLNLPATLAVQPVHALAGPVAAYNVSVLLACMLTGYGGFLLVRHFVPGVAIPFLCGALLLAGPFHLMKIQSNQLNLVSMQWIPLFMLALIWLNQSAGRHGGLPLPVSVLGAIGFFLLAALTDWYWALICGVYALLWCGLSLVQSNARGPLIRRYLLFGGGVALGLTPIFAGIARVRETLPEVSGGSTWQGYVQGYSADALGLFFPSAFHPLWGGWFRQVLEPVSAGYAPDGWYVAAGWVLLGCAALGVRQSWREQWRLLLIGAVAWLLALGPSLQIAGIPTDIPLPYALLQDVPLLGMARRPSHFAVICMLLATVFAGIGLQRLSMRWSRRRRTILLAGVSLLALIELWPPPRLRFTLDQPALYTQIRQLPGAVADLPLEWMETSRSLRNQIVHEQPIMGGYVARRPEYHTRRYVPLLRWISSMRRADDIVPLTHEALAAMQCHYPIRHIIVRKDLVPAERLPQLAEVVTTLNAGPPAPTFEDERHIWYELPLFANQCQPFVYLGAGWHSREYTATEQWRWAGAAGDIWLVNPFETTISATLHLRAEAPGGPDATRTVELWQDEQRIAVWQVERARRDYTVVVTLPPGSNRLQLRAPTTFDPQTERAVSIAVMELQIRDYYVNR